MYKCTALCTVKCQQLTVLCVIPRAQWSLLYTATLAYTTKNTQIVSGFSLVKVELEINISDSCSFSISRVFVNR